MAAALVAAGWDVLAWNFRGCGGEANRLLRFYHSGETNDLGAVIERAAAMYGRIALIGFSLGGNITLKYLGEARTHPAVVAGSASPCRWTLRRAPAFWIADGQTTFICGVCSSGCSPRCGPRPGNFRGSSTWPGARAIRTFRRTVRARYTAPLHGFRDAQDYWERSERCGSFFRGSPFRRCS